MLKCQRGLAEKIFNVHTALNGFEDFPQLRPTSTQVTSCGDGCIQK